MLNNNSKDCPLTRMSGQQKQSGQPGQPGQQKQPGQSGQWNVVGKGRKGRKGRKSREAREAREAHEVKDELTHVNDVSCIHDKPCGEDIPNKGDVVYATRVIKYLIAEYNLHTREEFKTGEHETRKVLYYYHKQTGVYTRFVTESKNTEQFIQRLFIELGGVNNVRQHFATYLVTFSSLLDWASLGQDNDLRVKTVGEILGEKGKLLFQFEHGSFCETITKEARVDYFGDWGFVLTGEVGQPVEPTEFDIIYDTENEILRRQYNKKMCD
jgi:hypothetical protein